MVSKNQVITQPALADAFLANINSLILAGAYHNGNAPHFSGTSLYKTNYNSNITYTAYTNPQAIPTADLDSVGNALADSNINAVGIKGNIIKGATVYSVLCDVIRKMTRVRNFTSRWYHKTNGSLALVNTVSGKAIFKETLSVLNSFPETNNTLNSGWSRTTNNTLQTISVGTSGIVKDSVIYADSVNTFLTNLNNAWAAVEENAIGYTFYSCHNNCHCHSNCDSRHRR
jgi:hypothetical protein